MSAREWLTDELAARRTRNDRHQRVLALAESLEEVDSESGSLVVRL